MARRDIVVSLPGFYYLFTRFGNARQRLFFFLRNWVPFLVLILLLGGADSTGTVHHLQTAVSLLLALAVYMDLYDWFCFENDHRAVRLESNPTLRSTQALVTSVPAFQKLKVIYFAGLWLLLALVAPWPALAGLAAVLGLTAVVFTTHNRLAPRHRLLTYFTLNLLKGWVFGVFFVDHLAGYAIGVYAAFSLACALSYLPRYTYYKLLLPQRERGEKYADPVFVQAAAYKNVFLLGLGLVLSPFLLIMLVVFDLFTAGELALARVETFRPNLEKRLRFGPAGRLAENETPLIGRGDEPG